jgi:hypothetical protein
MCNCYIGTYFSITFRMMFQLLFTQDAAFQISPLHVALWLDVLIGLAYSHSYQTHRTRDMSLNIFIQIGPN